MNVNDKQCQGIRVKLELLSADDLFYAACFQSLFLSLQFLNESSAVRAKELVVECVQASIISTFNHLRDETLALVMEVSLGSCTMVTMHGLPSRSSA